MVEDELQRELTDAEHHAVVLQREFSFESDFAAQMVTRQVELCRSGEPLLRVVDRVGYFVETTVSMIGSKSPSSSRARR